MICKVLIANRGEIAVRIAAAVQQMGMRAVAVYSDPDRFAPHVSAADEAHPLEGARSDETYLCGDKIIDISKTHGVDAIHPGYGFLSENAGFASACEAAGITFVGPKPDVIRDMGDKVRAKELMAAAQVPIVPGWSGGSGASMAEIREQACKIGYPVLVKAAAGGGGKGMRVVTAASELESAYNAARREAKNAFGDERVFLEKFIERPRHVEIQILGDDAGHAVHMFERECSIQRRHQKIIEESPSPALTEDLRNKMGDAAVRAARAIGYTNAGTVEFMVDATGAFYFLEVNTRLQVEHPVTELVTHRDLVALQMQIAAGEPIPFAQEDLRQDGHAIECRIYAEDPDHGFAPSIGTTERWVPPIGPGIRVDSGVSAGSEVSVHYDPMLAKLIVWEESRASAIEKMLWALDRFVVLGVTTNIPFLRRVMDHPAFRAGELHTQFLEEHPLPPATEDPPIEAIIAAALMCNAERPGTGARTLGGVSETAGIGPWQSAGHWRMH